MDTFNSQQHDALPALGWLFDNPHHGSPMLYHGHAVEVSQNKFVAGIILDYNTDPLLIENIFGSALFADNDNYTFLTPSHAFECLYIIIHGDGWCVSNSMAHIVGFLDCKIVFKTGYSKLFASNCHGIDDYTTEILYTSCGTVHRVIYDNLVVKPSGEFKFSRKPRPVPIRNFDAYIDRLTSDIRKIINYGHKKPERYEPVSTCSSGYDSTSVCALGKLCVLKDAITVINPNHDDGDSGTEICKILDLNILEVSQPKTEDNTVADLAIFLSTGMGGEDYFFISFADQLKNKILLSGFYGDNIWNIQGPAHEVFLRKELSGSSLQEFNLWNNTIHVPVPGLYARDHANILKISRSDDLRSYRTMNQYDRPIPRKILQDMGVPGHLFGQKKKAASIYLFRNFKFLGESNLEKLNDYSIISWPKKIQFFTLLAQWNIRKLLFNKFEYLKQFRLPAMGRLQNLVTINSDIFVHCNPCSSLHFVKSLQVISEKYRNIYD